MKNRQRTQNIRIIRLIYSILIITMIVVIYLQQIEISRNISSVVEKLEKQQEIVIKEETEVISEWQPYNTVPLEDEFQKYIYALCERYAVDFEVIAAMIKTESNFDVSAVGDNGESIGLMQIQPKWWKELADENNLNISNPKDNVHLGIIILVDALNDNDGNLDKALKQYNSGNPNTKSNTYVNKVYANMELI